LGSDLDIEVEEARLNYSFGVKALM